MYYGQMMGTTASGNNSLSQFSNKKSLVFVIIAVVQFVIIIVLAVMLVAVSSSETKPTDDNVVEFDDENMEIGDGLEKTIGVEANTPIVLWAAANDGQIKTVARRRCLDMVEFSNSYSKQYDKTALSISFCDDDKISLTTETSNQDSYPFSEQKVIYIKIGDECSKFEFYPSFTIMRGFENGQNVCRAADKTLDLVREE